MTLRSLINALDGRKTYILAIITAVLNFAVAMNWLTPEHMTQINTLLGSLIAMALRAGIAKSA